MSVVISVAEQLLFVYTMDCYNVLFGVGGDCGLHTHPQLTVDNDTPVVVDQTADSVDNSDAVAVG